MEVTSFDAGTDAMEGSISGGGCRPSVNAMFYGNAMGIAALATELGETALATNFTQRAATIRKMYLRLLWNPEIEFFAVWKDGSPAKRGPHNATNGIPFGFPKWVCGSGAPNGGPPQTPSSLATTTMDPVSLTSFDLLPPVPTRPVHCPQTIKNYSWACNKTVGVRELLGLGPPWYFEVPPTNGSGKYQTSWSQLFDEQGFKAKWGPTTVERRDRCFNWTADEGQCNWAGPSWPYETSRVITGLSNLLHNYPNQPSTTTKQSHTPNAFMTKAHYMQLLRQYAQAHTQSKPANASLPYIGENIEPDHGWWQARQVMYGDEPGSHGYKPAQDDRDRSVDYNHSTFADLIIEGLVGLCAAFGNIFTVNPLATGLKYFALDNIFYHNHSVSVAWDENGVRGYTGCTRGFCVYVDGKVVATSPTLSQLNITLLSAGQ
jgi:hypothetical protein